MDEAENGSLPVADAEANDLPVNDTPDAGTGEVETKAVEQEKPKTEVPKWAKDRFGELTAKRHAAEQKAQAEEARAARLEAELQQYKQGNVPDAAPADYQSLINNAAEQIAAKRFAEQSFNQRCNDVAAKGKAELGGEFDKALENFGNYFGGLSPDFLNVATKLPDAHKVLAHLGKDENLGEYQRITNLDPVSMALELSTMSRAVSKAATKPVSNAPAPITPLDGSGSVNTDPEKMTDSEWKKWRETNRKSRR